MGEEAKGVKFPAIVPPMAGSGINSNNVNNERNNTRTVVTKRLEILDFNMILSFIALLIAYRFLKAIPIAIIGNLKFNIYGLILVD
jgi:hypothetical protein